tara:strand:- start:72 stop:179 length:108 start_codon:yes stop_codon:yes gene_type:complete
MSTFLFAIGLFVLMGVFAFLVGAFIRIGYGELEDQ